MQQPVATEPYWPDHDAPMAWEQAVEALSRAQTFWLATLHPAGRPHVVPVLAVWLEALVVAVSPDSRKVRNLKQNPAATVSTHAERFDLVIDGTATRVADEERLERIVNAYAAKYGWSVNVREGALQGEGAPTAGPGPYHVYELEQAAVGLVGGPPLHERGDAAAQRADLSGERAGGELAGVAAGAQRERIQQDASCLVGHVRLAGDRIGDQLTTAAQQVRQAGLVGGPPQAGSARAVCLPGPARGGRHQLARRTGHPPRRSQPQTVGRQRQ